MAHNISINVTDADSPVGVRRRIHLRSLSDVTPSSRSSTPRARSHSERPRASAAPSPAASPAPSAAHSAAPSPARLASPAAPRAARSERSSPDVAAHIGHVLDDPWRKMSAADLDAGSRRYLPASPRASLDAPRALDPWVVNTLRSTVDGSTSRDDVASASSDPEPRSYRRGKLERKAAVVCESCGNSSCECWRPRSPAGAQCTCEARSPRAGRAARPSPARLLPRTPVRAHSDDEERPRRLYKSASQKVVGTSIDSDSVKRLADPLLETTC